MAESLLRLEAIGRSPLASQDKTVRKGSVGITKGFSLKRKARSASNLAAAFFNEIYKIFIKVGPSVRHKSEH